MILNIAIPSTAAGSRPRRRVLRALTDGLAAVSTGFFRSNRGKGSLALLTDCQLRDIGIEPALRHLDSGYVPTDLAPRPGLFSHRTRRWL